jgi:hypothetical protein
VQSLDWRQGEHVTFVGPTHAGKSTLAAHLLDLREYVVVVATKPKDPIVAEFERRGYYVVRSWPPPEPRDLFSKVVFWPKISSMADIKRQRLAIRTALADMFKAGGWAIYLDEGKYVLDYLRLGSYADVIWQQGRTQDLSFIIGTQRPAWIPLNAYSQATHLFFWQTNETRDIQRMAELSPLTRQELEGVMQSLSEDRHSFVYVNTRTREVATSKVELKEVAA